MTEDVQTPDDDDEARSWFNQLGLTITLEDGTERLEVTRGNRRNTDRRICVCGHGMSRHWDFHGVPTCRPSRLDCPCKLMITVAEVEDIRCFMWQTIGYGGDHALTRGLLSLAAKGKRAWKNDETWVCGKCGTREEELTACAITEDWKVSRRAEKINALLCERCIEEVGIV